MRPGQKNRMRGRNNNGNNRRGPNPLTRSYESNGPDVKVRGTAAHIAEKYVQLARDAHSSGDGVLAESYLQHAEHYYRLIAAAHAQQQAQFNPPQPGQGGATDHDVGDDEDEFEVAGADRFTYRSPQSFNQPQGATQPSFPGQPYAGEQPQPDTAYADAQPPMPRQDRQYGERQPGERVQGERNQGDRPPRDSNGDRGQGGERPERQGDRFSRRDRFRDRGPRPFPPQAPQPAMVMDDQPPAGLPAFITAGRPPVDEAPEPQMSGGDGEGRFRNRRRRLPRGEGQGDKTVETSVPGPASVDSE